MSGAGWIQRVGRMDAAELVFRARTAARSRAQYLTTAWRPRGWRRDSLSSLLRPSAGSIDTALERLDARDWHGAHEALSEHFHRRVSRFPVSPHALPELADRVRRRFPHAAGDAAERADNAVAGRFDVLGYTALEFASPGGPVDWHYDPVHDRHAPNGWWSRVRYLDPASGDHKIIWELNRHQHFLALGRAAWLTGRREYRDTFVRHLEDWLRANPPLAGINWASMLELSFRALSWLWALHLFVESPDAASPSSPANAGIAESHAPSWRSAASAGLSAADRRQQSEAPWMVDLLIGLERQLSHVQQNLSLYFSPNTHLTGEALALYVCGRALPELLPAASWEETGRTVLLDQMDRQVAPDGGHVERSTHYQRYTLDFYLLALAMARVTDDPCADRFAAVVDRLAAATRLYADAHGSLPLIGDDDGGVLFPICGRPAADVRDSLALAAALLGRPELAIDGTPEETMWLLGNQPAWIIQKKAKAASNGLDPLQSTALPDTGYFVSRPRPCDHVVIDAGPHGYLNGGHAHADALSLTASLDGRSLFIDPGTGTYTMSAEVRDRFRDSRMHNTLTLDGRSQSVPAGPFHWKTIANGRMQRWATSPGLDYFEGVQDGYLPAIHRRRAVVVPGGPVVVVDTVFGDGESHRAEVFWHLAPEWRLDGAEAGGISLRHASGAHAWLLSLGAQTDFFVGDEGGLGWHAPVYGRIEHALTLRLAVERSAPIAVVTVFGDGHSAAAPSIARLPLESEVAGADVVALQMRGDAFTDLLVFGYREPVLPPRDERRGARPVAQTPAAADRPLVRAGGIETDARFLCLRLVDESEDWPAQRPAPTGEAQERPIAILDGTHLRRVGSGESLLPAGFGGDGLFVRRNGAFARGGGQ